MGEIVPETDAALARIALDRARACAPFLVLALIAAMVITGPSGIPLSRAVVVVNAVAMVAAVGLWLLLRSGRDLDRHGHRIGALLWGVAPGVTIATEIINRAPSLTVPFMIELITASIMTSTRWCVALVVGATAVWLPLELQADRSQLGLYLGGVLGSGIAAIVLQVVMRRALVRAEAMRVAQDQEIDAHLKTAERLADELEERRRAEAEREGLRDQFVHSQRMEAVGTMAAGLAHDLNNILAAMLGIVELIRDDSTDPQVRADCDAVLREGLRGAELTRSLLAFSRRGQTHRRAVGVDAQLDQLTTLLRRTLPKTIVVERRGGTDASVEVDVAQLQQALMNLCLNAADAMPDGGTLTLTTGVTTVTDAEAAELEVPPGRSWVTIAVSDTGCGMTPAVQRRIFEPFYTTKPLGKGTGLGLAMVYGAVKAHDGAIAVTSQPGQGSQFRLLLPAADVPRVEAARPADSGRIRQARVVLVVDDEPQVRATTTRLLERMGLTVVAADNGAEALEVFAARKDEIALVVLDMAMPVMGGAACFRELRRQSRVPVLVASGYAIEHEAQELMAAGAVGFLAKPYTAAELGASVERALTGAVATA